MSKQEFMAFLAGLIEAQEDHDIAEVTFGPDHMDVTLVEGDTFKLDMV